MFDGEFEVGLGVPLQDPFGGALVWRFNMKMGEGQISVLLKHHSWKEDHSFNPGVTRDKTQICKRRPPVPNGHAKSAEVGLGLVGSASSRND